MSHAGVGPLTALAYVLIIGKPERFHCGKQIGTYVGMIPSEDSSAKKQRLGHISKQGNSLLRFLLVEAAQAAARVNPQWRRRYMHLAMRRHKSIAKVAMGRKLGVRLYWMWRNGCAYSPHPVHATPQLSPHRYLGNALVSTHRQVHVPTSPLRIDSCCRLGGLHQQESQQRVALFADVPQSLLLGTGVLTRNHPHVRADLLAAVEPLRFSDDQHIGEGRQWAHTRMGHQSQNLGSLFCFLLVGGRQLVNRRTQAVQQLQQLLPAPTGP